MNEKIEEIKSAVINALQGASTLADIEAIRVKYFGRKSPFKELFVKLAAADDTTKREFGPKINELKTSLESDLEQRAQDLTQPKEVIDFDSVKSQPLFARQGSSHIVSQMIAKIEDIMAEIGFQAVSGPEMETDYYNFEALNMGKDHPARDTQDTFYLDNDLILRTQTSAVQIRVMEKHKPPVKIISAGKTYRRDDDLTHTPMFHQVEGLFVDKDINLGHLKWTIEYLLKKLFGKNLKMRYRTSYFPYTEPSLEVDIECQSCLGEGCRVCKKSGWLEVMGAGLVNPVVLENLKIDPKVYTGFAFGLGIERIVMLKTNLGDMRLLYQSNLQFLEQYK